MKQQVDRSQSNSTVAMALLLGGLFIAIVILLINVIQCQSLPIAVRAIAGFALVILVALLAGSMLSE